MIKITKHRKSASEMFHLLIPILLFMFICLIFIIVFSFLEQSFIGKKLVEIQATDFTISNIDPSFRVSLNNILMTNFPSKESNNYNLSLYEIIYYNLESLYDSEIKSIFRQSFLFDNNIVLTIYQNEMCALREAFSTSSILSYSEIRPLKMPISSVIINNRCVDISYLDFSYHRYSSQYDSFTQFDMVD
ncbi:MAG: hypothetical protein ACMXYG_07075 [Candidatus Woesearchaeota archaeon]